MSFLSSIGLGFVDEILHQVDDFVNEVIPGGWLAPVAVGAAVATGGTSLALLGTEAAAGATVAEAATVATAAEAGLGFEGYMAANGITAATAEAGAAALAVDATATEGTLAKMAGSELGGSTLTAKEVISGVNTATSAATSALKISSLTGASQMNVKTPTATAMISPSPIDTGQVLATTPQGPILTSQAQAGQNASISQKDLMVVAAAVAALYFVWKNKAV